MRKEYLLLIISGTLYGTITAGGQYFVNLGFSLYEITFFRILSVMVLTLPIIAVRPNLFLNRKQIPFFILYGLIGALLGLCMFGGLIFGVPVSIVALLLYTQPIWTTILGKYILNESVTLRKTLSVTVGIVAIFVLFYSWNVNFTGSKIGILISLAGGFLLSLWIIMGRKTGISKIHFVTTIFGWKIFTLLWLLILYPLFNLITQDPSIINIRYSLTGTYILYFIIFAFVGGLLPHILFYKSITTVNASEAGIILLLEPLSASIIAIILFGQYLSFHTVIGGILILISNYVLLSGKNNNVNNSPL
jgi:drug/metabolite transporter, DME family